MPAEPEAATMARRRLNDMRDKYGPGDTRTLAAFNDYMQKREETTPCHAAPQHPHSARPQHTVGRLPRP
uniref:Uncharacterized protein n=1 Tax=viral metagenome TaxID=1070528 RepID=A0A6M3L1G1_9ZZZZ